MAIKIKNVERSGIHAFPYMGVNPLASFSQISTDREPTSDDLLNLNVGDIWIVRDDTTTPPSFESIWMLAKKDETTASWIRFVTSNDASQYDTDSGTATPSSGVLQIVGGATGLLSTSGSGNTVTLEFPNGTDGQLFIGETASTPGWANFTSSGGTVVITNGDNTINIEAVGVGGGYITALDTDSGMVNPIGQNVDYLGGTNITTSASGSTLTIDLDNDVTLAGSLTMSTLTTGVIQTSGAGLVSSTTGTNGQLLIDSTAGTASWASITSSGATVTITNGANSIDLSVPVGAAVYRYPYLASLSSTASGVLGTGTGTYLGKNVVLTEIFDVGSDFYPGNGSGTSAKFTAPSTAKYYLNVNVKYGSSSTINYFADLVLKIVTSNRTYVTDITTKTSPGLSEVRNIGVYADMDATDTAECFVAASETSGASIDIEGASTGLPITWMSGFKTR